MPALVSPCGFIPGVKPGAKTAEYIDHVVSRITFPGSLFLTFIALLPVFIADMIDVPFRFGGTSLLMEGHWSFVPGHWFECAESYQARCLAAQRRGTND